MTKTGRPAGVVVQATIPTANNSERKGESKMKLTKAQQKAMNEARETIDTARDLDYPEWMLTKYGYRDNELGRAMYKEDMENGRGKDWWKQERDGILYVYWDGKVLHNLADMGLIEILFDATGTKFGQDTIKVLNY